MDYFEESEKETKLFELYIESQSRETNDQDTSNTRTHRGRDEIVRGSV